MRARSFLLSMLGAVAFVAGCAGAADDGATPDDLTSATGALTVSGAASRSCSTLAVRGLAEQLVAELACLDPTVVTKIDAADTLSIEPEVFPYLQPAAAEALKSAVAAYGKPMKLNSALRTLPQQYMLRRWAAGKRCGVSVAAPVGESNHESGLAVDIDVSGTAATRRAVRAALQAQSFTWLGASDPVHFDFKGDDGKDLQGLSVLAFKRLWNRNHPEAPLVLDETYDAKTEAKLRVSPAAGFATGARCDER
jgi:hypothetical protein